VKYFLPLDEKYFTFIKREMAATEDSLEQFLDKLEKEFAPSLEEYRECPSEIVLGKEIGKGKYGRVYSGKYNNKDVAIKVLDLSDEAFSRESRQIKQEALISKYLTLECDDAQVCPIIPIHDVFLCNSDDMLRSYIVMGLSRGYDLRQLITKRHEDSWYNIRYDSITRRNIGLYENFDGRFIMNLKITILLITGLMYLHDKHVYHQDIKLDNILIDLSSPNNVIKYIDFGLSCIYLNDTSLSESIKEKYKELNCLSMKGVRGTPNFIHPYAFILSKKLKEGTPVSDKLRRKLSKITDCYSLGVVLYMLWTGSFNFLNVKTVSGIRKMASVYAREIKDREGVDLYMDILGYRPDVMKLTDGKISEYKEVMEIINEMTTFSLTLPKMDNILNRLQNMLDRSNK